MLWFLRLFPAFRALALNYSEALTKAADLRDSLDEIAIEKLRLQDRLDAALTDKEHLWNSMQDAIDNERAALRMQVNHAVQKAGGGIPYPDAHSLPSSAVRPLQAPGPVGRQGRILASEAITRRTQQWINEELAPRMAKVAE
jgi:hypothetical protein